MSGPRSLSIAETVELLGLERPDPARWLRRRIRRRERATGQRILVDVGGGGARPTYRVHLARLRALCPELFDPELSHAQAVKREGRDQRLLLRGVQEAVDELRLDLIVRHDQQTARVEQLLASVRQLVAQLRSVTR